MTDLPPLPRLLLVEDDPVSAQFLRHGLEALPARVDVAGSVATAIQCAALQRYALWLIDARLPDGDGRGLLDALRARHADTPALAHTADTDPATHRALLAAGFLDVLVKPLSTATLCQRVAQVLGDTADWNDAQALRALGGERAHVAALRRLFLDELPQLQAQLLADARRGDAAAMDAVLHRLQASCAFVGADRLGQAVRALRAAPLSAPALDSLLAAAQSLPTSYSDITIL